MTKTTATEVGKAELLADGKEELLVEITLITGKEAIRGRIITGKVVRPEIGRVGKARLVIRRPMEKMRIIGASLGRIRGGSISALNNGSKERRIGIIGRGWKQELCRHI